MMTLLETWSSSQSGKCRTKMYAYSSRGSRRLELGPGGVSYLFFFITFQSQSSAELEAHPSIIFSFTGKQSRLYQQPCAQPLLIFPFRISEVGWGKQFTVRGRQYDLNESYPCVIPLSVCVETETCFSSTGYDKSYGMSLS